MAVSTEYKSDDYLHLNSCGIQNLKNRDYYTVREGGRIDYHILYVIEGRCYAKNLDKETVLNAGEMILFKPKETQKYSFFMSDNPISGYIHFTGTACETLIDMLGFNEDRVLHLSKSLVLLNILRKMTEEYYIKRPFYNEMLSAYLIEFFAAAAREKRLEKNAVYKSNKTKIDSVCKKMFEEYKYSYRVEHYAKYANLSTSRFYFVFKQSTGVSPVEYMNKLKINQAKELLKNTDSSVSEVSEAVGFSDQNYFGRVFKHYVGISPKKYSSQHSQ